MRNRPLDKKDKKIHMSNLLAFYGKQEDEILHACVYRHKQEIFDAIESKNERLEYVYKCHLEAVKSVLEDRYT